MLALQIPDGVIDAGKKAGETLSQTALGSLVVILFIVAGVAVWLAFRAKESEIKTWKEVAEIKSSLFQETREAISAQTKAHEDLAKLVEGTNKITVDLGKRIDSLAKADSNVDISKYFSKRE
jgi:hypothetical protein